MALSSSTVADIVIGGAAAASGVVLGIKKFKDVRAKKKEGLGPNPERCIDHESRLRTVEASCIEYKTEIKGMKDDISEIKEDVKTLLRR